MDKGSRFGPRRTRAAQMPSSGGQCRWTPSLHPDTSRVGTAQCQRRKLVEIDVERVPSGGLAQSASLIASLAAECPIPAKRIEVWRYSEQAPPTSDVVQEYLVLQSFARDINLPKFAERASTHDSPALREHLRAHVFLVKALADTGRWEPKARTRERIVFLSV